MLPDPRHSAVQGRLAELLPHLDVDAYAGRTLLLTGGTGFFGYWLLSLFDLLAERGIDLKVRALSRRPAAFAARAPWLATRPWLTWINGNARDFHDDVRADFILHAATDTHADAHRHLLAIMDDVLLGTRHTLAHGRDAGTSRMLYVSSGAVYGPQPAHLERLDEASPYACDACHPYSAYGEAKRAAEQWCLQFGLLHGITIPVARCFAFAGAGLPLDGHFAIGNFIGDALAGRPIQVAGDGSPIRSYLHGADLAIWLLQLLAHGEHGRAYNVGSDQAVSIGDLADTVRQTLASPHPVHIARRATDTGLRNRYVPSIERARHELGLDVWTPLPDAIRLTAAALTA